MIRFLIEDVTVNRERHDHGTRALPRREYANAHPAHPTARMGTEEDEPRRHGRGRRAAGVSHARPHCDDTQPERASLRQTEDSLRGRWSLISSKITMRSRVAMNDCVIRDSSPKRRWPRDLASRRQRFGHGRDMACSMRIRIRTEANACTNHQENIRRGKCKVTSLPTGVYYRSFIATTEGDAV